MSDFTIEQLEALKEGTTPGPWVVKRESPTMQQAYFNIHRQGDHRTRIKGYTNGHNQDPELIAAAPALVDTLIAEKRKHDDLRQEIGSLIGKLETRAENAHSNRSYTSAVAFRESARNLARILEADNG